MCIGVFLVGNVILVVSGAKYLNLVFLLAMIKLYNRLGLRPDIGTAAEVVASTEVTIELELTSSKLS